MCGRYAQFQSGEAVAELFEIESIPQLSPRYNIAPTQQVATISSDAKTGDRSLKFRHWGLIPSWAKDKAISSKLINARAETLAEKPSFRRAFATRRCLIIADGFYEWQKLGKEKQPFYIHLKGDRTFAFAGLWEEWKSPENEVIESCTIITTTANETIAPIHERMPVILAPETYESWLDPKENDRQKLEQILHLNSQLEVKTEAIATKVNNPKYDRPDCMEKI
jgi:putative SOS response-associated peptidase YedK